MQQLKRYNCPEIVEMTEIEEGEWVRYDDIIELISYLIGMVERSNQNFFDLEKIYFLDKVE